MQNKFYKSWIFWLFIVFGAIYAITSCFDIPIILNDLSLGIVSASIFYFITVYIPAQQKRKLIKRHLTVSYHNMKHNILQNIIWAAGIDGNYSILASYGDIEQMLDYAEFRKRFENNDNWGSFLSGLDKRSDILKDILTEFEKFSEELSFVLLLYQCNDKQYRAIRNWQNAIVDMKNADYETFADNIKPLSRALWEMYTAWSFIGGQHDSDAVQSFINRL